MDHFIYKSGILYAEDVAAAVRGFGVTRGTGKAEGGADIGAISKVQKLAIIDLQQDGTRYFDLHHTPDDTLDKIDPAQLRQNVTVWAATLAILADSTDSELP